MSPTQALLFRLDVPAQVPDPEGEVVVTATPRGHATCELKVELPTAEHWILDFASADCAGEPAKLDGNLPPGRYYVSVRVKDGQGRVPVRLDGRFGPPQTLSQPPRPSPASAEPTRVRIIGLQGREDDTLLLFDRGQEDGIAAGATGVLVTRRRTAIAGATVRILFVARYRCIGVTTASGDALAAATGAALGQ